MAQRGSFWSRLFGGRPVPSVKPMSEQGVSGTSVISGFVVAPEKSPKWIGSEKYRTASEIVTNVSIVAAGVHHFLNLVARPAWSVVPADDESEEAKELAEFVEEVIHDMESPWARVVRRSGMYRFYGFNIQEWTAKKRDDGRIGFKDIEVRPQSTIEEWSIDEDGTILGAWQRHPNTGQMLGLPRKKIIYIVEDTLSDSPEGLGVFRHMAEPYERLKQYQALEARGFERDLRGTPVGRVPITLINQAVTDGILKQAEADALIRGMEDFVKLQVKQSDTGIILDSMPYETESADGTRFASQQQWGLDLLRGEAAGLSELNESINRINREMARIIGVEHLLLGESVGSRSLSEDKSKNLALLANGVLNTITASYDADVIGPLWTLNNFPEELKPHFATEGVEFKDAAAITAALRDMATAGAVLDPTDEVINDIRDLLGVSRAPEPTPMALGALGRDDEGEPMTQEEIAAAEEEAAQAEHERAMEQQAARRPPATQKYSPNQPRDERGRWADQQVGAFDSSKWTGNTTGGHPLVRAFNYFKRREVQIRLGHAAADFMTKTGFEMMEQASSIAIVHGVLQSTLFTIMPQLAGGNMLAEAAAAVAVSTIAAKLGLSALTAKRALIASVSSLIRSSPIAKDDGSDEEMMLALLEHFLRGLRALPDNQLMMKYSPSQPRDERGRWTDTGSAGSGGAHPGEGYSSGARVVNGVIHTTDVEDAVRALHEGRKVELDQPNKVSTLLNRLSEVAKDMEAKGEKARNYDLCNVAVRGSNLFCAESKGIPRVQMPQLKGKPTEGSRADKLPRDVRGEVDISAQFRQHMIDRGYAIEDVSERADFLRATQNELNGVKVAGIAGAIRNNQLADERLFVSRDNYIVDGHHRWAATVGVDFDDNRSGDLRMPVARMNTDIITVINEAKIFANDWGIPQADVTKRRRVRVKAKRG